MLQLVSLIGSVIAAFLPIAIAVFVFNTVEKNHPRWAAFAGAAGVIVLCAVIATAVFPESATYLE